MMLSVENERTNTVKSGGVGIKVYRSWQFKAGRIRESPSEMSVHPPSSFPYNHVSLVLVLMERSCLDRHVSLRILASYGVYFTT